MKIVNIVFYIVFVSVILLTTLVYPTAQNQYVNDNDSIQFTSSSYSSSFKCVDSSVVENVLDTNLDDNYADLNEESEEETVLACTYNQIVDDDFANESEINISDSIRIGVVEINETH